MKHLVLRLFVPALAALTLPVVATAQTIDNLSNWNGTTDLGSFGTGGGFSSANTFGQTFVAPADSFLKSWETAFNGVGSTPFTYRFYIALCDDASGRSSGSPVFTSGDLTSPMGQYTNLKIDTNVLLTPGATYVAFTSTSEFSPAYSPTTVTTNQAGYSLQDTYLSGGFVKNDGGSFTDLFVNGWDTRFASMGWDTAFRAEFQAVPEPATFAVLGLGALAATRRRKRS